jgi:rRNA maturation endonuclease Nob1
VSDTDESVTFCPYCGGEIELENDDDEDDYNEYEE